VRFFAGNACRYPVVRDAATAIGWEVVDENASEKIKDSCNFIWIDTSNINDFFLSIQPWQRINHFPGMTNIARKSRLAEHLDSMKKRFKNDYAFYPQTFIIPRDKHHMKKYFEPAGRSKITFIVKPDGGCQGRGIFLTKQWDTIDALSTTHVAQRYISDPLLIDKKKFDLRIYVLITSCDPLRIYLFQDGLVRLCTEDFVKPNLGNLDDACMHLSNYSINKRSDNFSGSGDTSGSSGSKRSIKWFLSWIEDTKGKGEAQKLWSKIGHICVKTIISIEPILVREYKNTFNLNGCESDHQYSTKADEVFTSKIDQNVLLSQESSKSNSMDQNDRSHYNDGYSFNWKQDLISGSRSMAILGFDIMVDSKLRPHLIEVNHLPSFATDSPLDASIKSKVVLQALKSVQASVTDKKFFEAQAKLIVQKRLLRKRLTSTNHQIKHQVGDIGEKHNAVNDSVYNYTLQKQKLAKESTRSSSKGNKTIEDYVTEVYSIHAPEKMDKIQVLLEKYRGHEDWLRKKLGEKYCACSKMQSGHDKKQLDGQDQINNNNQVITENEISVSERYNENISLTEGEVDSTENIRTSPYDKDLIHEDDILVTHGDYERIFPPRKGKYKTPCYESMRNHSVEEDSKRQNRLVCPLWQLRMCERQDGNITLPQGTEGRSETLKNNETQNYKYSSRGDWLVHGNVHRKSEPIPTKIIPLPSQKQLEAAERLSRGFSVESNVFISEEEASSSTTINDFVTRLSMAEQAGKEMRKKNEEKFVPRSQLNVNPINIAFGHSSFSCNPNQRSGERCYVDFSGRKLGYR